MVGYSYTVMNIRANDSVRILLVVTQNRVKRHFPGRAFLVTNTADIPKVLRGFLTTMVDR